MIYEYLVYFSVGELVEWIGFAIACWSLPAYAFALYTFCNLGPRALKVRSYCTVLYCTVLYYTVLFYSILYY